MMQELENFDFCENVNAENHFDIDSIMLFLKLLNFQTCPLFLSFDFFDSKITPKFLKMFEDIEKTIKTVFS